MPTPPDNPSPEWRQLAHGLKICIHNNDIEEAHRVADGLLIVVAMSTTLTKHERETLVQLYRLVDKWYA